MDWSHASAYQVLRILVGAEGANKPLLDFADEVVGPCEVRQAFDMAHHVPVAGASSASSFNEKLLVDPLLWDNVIAWNAIDLSSK